MTKGEYDEIVRILSDAGRSDLATALEKTNGYDMARQIKIAEADLTEARKLLRVALPQIKAGLLRDDILAALAQEQP